MSLDLIIKVCGVLGFVISLATFILTRYEKRKKIEIELFSSAIDEFESNDDLVPRLSLFKVCDGVLKIRFINISQHSIILKPRTLTIKTGKYSYNLNQGDFLRMDTFDELMPPNSMREIGVYFDEMKSSLNIKDSKNFTEAEEYSLKVTICDHVGKKFRNNMYTYEEATNRYLKK
ncbi:MAG: hypothetical protein H7178_11945 [Chitinophagaceae bacterium]|nr:hypothetical protein [Chitinophagaceae bacterium]